MVEVYPVFIKEQGEDFLVYVPDMGIYTEGKNFADAILMARDAIGLKGISIEADGESLPKPSNSEEAKRKAEKDVNFTEYRRKTDNKSVKKNCTIPYWLSIEAEKANINFSKTLQEALIEKLE